MDDDNIWIAASSQLAWSGPIHHKWPWLWCRNFRKDGALGIDW